MEGPTNQISENESQSSLQILQDKSEYLGIMGEFFEDQTILINNLIYDMELKDRKSLNEQQEMTGKLSEGAEVKRKLINKLIDLKIKQRTGKPLAHYKNNGLYKCPECPYKSKIISNFKTHFAALHLKLKIWKCSKCSKGKILNNIFGYFDLYLFLQF